MRFEKWQALANDYVIVEAAELGPAPLTPELVRALCDRHTGIGADGVLVLGPPDEPGFVARLRIFNPDGSEAELSGNGARQAILYLRRAGWTDARQFSIQTAAGEIRPTILSDTTCRVDMGRASLRHAGRGPRLSLPAPRHRQPADGDPRRRPPRRSRRSTSPRSARRSRPTRSSPSAPTSRGSPRSTTRPSARGSSSAGWGRRPPAAPAPAARPSPTSCAAATRR